MAQWSCAGSKGSGPQVRSLAVLPIHVLIDTSKGWLDLLPLILKQILFSYTHRVLCAGEHSEYMSRTHRHALRACWDLHEWTHQPRVVVWLRRFFYHVTIQLVVQYIPTIKRLLELPGSRLKLNTSPRKGEATWDSVPVRSRLVGVSSTKPI